jgi:adhesin transport system outer membrane protein
LEVLQLNNIMANSVSPKDFKQADRGTGYRAWRGWLSGWLFMLAASWCSAQPLALADLIETGMQNHPNLKAGLAAQRAAQRSLEAAEWQRYPTPSLSIEGVKASGNDTSYQADDTVTTLRLSQPLYTGGALTAQIDRAKAQLRIAQANVLEARQQVSLQVIQSYADWLAAELKTQAWRRSLVLHEKLLQTAKNRINQGVSSASDLSLVQGRLDATASEVFSASLQAELALNRLREQLDMPLPADQLSLQAAAPFTGELHLDSLLQDAETQSPALRKIHAQAGVQRAGTQEREAALLPDIALRVERQIGHFSINNTSPENRVFLSVSTKLGAGLSSMSAIASAKALEDSAEMETLSQRRALREKIVNAYQLHKSFPERRRLLSSALASSQLALESFERQFAAGRKSWLDLITAARDVAMHEAQIADLKGAEIQTAWHLKTLTASDLADMDTQP